MRSPGYSAGHTHKQANQVDVRLVHLFCERTIDGVEYLIIFAVAIVYVRKGEFLDGGQGSNHFCERMLEKSSTDEVSAF